MAAIKSTDVIGMFDELGDGQFASELGTALSTAGLACVDHDGKAEVTLKFTFEPAGAGAQIAVSHVLSYKYPVGVRTQQTTVPGKTVLVVNEDGVLTLFPTEHQLNLPMQNDA